VRSSAGIDRRWFTVLLFLVFLQLRLLAIAVPIAIAVPNVAAPGQKSGRGTMAE